MLSDMQVWRQEESGAGCGSSSNLGITQRRGPPAEALPLMWSSARRLVVECGKLGGVEQDAHILGVYVYGRYVGLAVAVEVGHGEL